MIWRLRINPEVSFINLFSHSITNLSSHYLHLFNILSSIRHFAVPFLASVGASTCWSLVFVDNDKDTKDSSQDTNSQYKDNSSKTPTQQLNLYKIGTVAIFAFCVLANVCLSPLLEFRYFALPLFFVTILMPIQQNIANNITAAMFQEMIGLSIVVLSNILIFALFFLKTWTDKERWGAGVQRLML